MGVRCGVLHLEVHIGEDPVERNLVSSRSKPLEQFRLVLYKLRNSVFKYGSSK